MRGSGRFGGPDACQRTHYVSRCYSRPLSDQHAAVGWPRQADCPRGRHHLLTIL